MLSKKAIEIKRKLKTRESGPAVDNMAKYGIVYKKNRGLQLHEIKRISTEYKYNHELAVELWKPDFREFNIIATHIEDPDTVTEEQINDWVKNLKNTELAEQISINLLVNIPFAKEKINEWIDFENIYSKKAAFVLISRLAVLEADLFDEFFEQFFPKIKEYSNTDNVFLRKSVSLALRKIGRRNKKLNFRSIKLAGEISLLKSESAEWVANDVFLELQDEIVQSKFN